MPGIPSGIFTKGCTSWNAGGGGSSAEQLILAFIKGWGSQSPPLGNKTAGCPKQDIPQGPEFSISATPTATRGMQR